MPAPSNIKELRDNLLERYDELQKDPRRVIQASELANIAGKVHQGIKLELECCALRKDKDVNIPFLKYAK